MHYDVDNHWTTSIMHFQPYALNGSLKRCSRKFEPCSSNTLSSKKIYRDFGKAFLGIQGVSVDFLVELRKILQGPQGFFREISRRFKWFQNVSRWSEDLRVVFWGIFIWFQGKLQIFFVMHHLIGVSEWFQGISGHFSWISWGFSGFAWGYKGFH